MLDYEECKKVFSDKLQNDLLGKGRIEAAFFAAIKFAYQRGYEDALIAKMLSDMPFAPFGAYQNNDTALRKLIAKERKAALMEAAGKFYQSGASIIERRQVAVEILQMAEEIK